MEIKKPYVATLSNYEVMAHLQKIKDRKNRNKGQLATITYETLKYLEKSPCKLQSPQDISDFLKALEPFNLNKNEKLILVNNPPRTPLEIQLIIEESEERLSEEQVDEILQIVSKYLHVSVVTDDTQE